MNSVCPICLIELDESQEEYCAVCKPLADLYEWPMTREEERELRQSCCQVWQERAVKAEAELARFKPCHPVQFPAEHVDGVCEDWGSEEVHYSQVYHKKPK